MRKKSVMGQAPRASAIIIEREKVTRVGCYQLLESIGKGGFGIVYRGVDVNTGVSVAIKRIKLQGVPKEELANIESEISLLKNLIHANIVKYVDAIQEDDHLNIVLEYVENGALSGMVARFGGQLPERLCRIYIAQVIRGLEYLHEQGVIHRDIKGANILATKDGVIKLADFGVATKLNESKKSDSVVGTPYWMAPEIIEMTGVQSSACDIWSVGCTVIELLTGKPPYFDLQQMPALFRIVQDDHPPLPDDISPALTDFLLQCFAKDPFHRISAKGLLKHPWLKDVSVEDEKSRRETEADEVAKHKKKEEKQKIEQEEALARMEQDLTDSWKNTPADAEIGPITPTKKPLTPSAVADPAARVSKVPATPQAKLAFPPQSPAPGSHVLDDTFEIGDDDEMELEGLDGLPDIDTIGKEDTRVSKTSSNGSDTARANTKVAIVDATQKITSFVEKESDEPLGEIELEIDEVDVEVINQNKNKPWDPEEGGERDDPFDEITFPTDPEDTDSRIAKIFARQCEGFNIKNEERIVLDAIEGMGKLFKENPTQVRALMTSQNGSVIPIMELLESQNANILHAVLKLINEIVLDNPKFQQNMSLVGLVPAIIKFAGKACPTEIRIEAANFIRQFCYASDFTRKMFIACGGLPALVGFLQEDYTRNKTIVWNAIDCIRHVFDIKSSPKNHFCRLFCKFGLLYPLTRTLKYVNMDRDSSDAPDYVRKIGEILYLFSNGDPVVKQHFAKPAVIENMLKVLPSPTLPQNVLLLILKSIRNICMDPITLDSLESAGTIPALVPFLNSNFAENQNQVLAAMYDLVKIKPSRQDQAAAAGIIPPLQRIIQSDLTIKQFAFPIIFLLANSKRSRMELKKYGGVQFYLNILNDKYWRNNALEAITVWLQDDPDRVTFILSKPGNINKLLTVFQTTSKSVQFEKMLPLFRKILTWGPINQAFGRSDVFIKELQARLQRHSNSNNIRINLLKILAMIIVAHKSPKALISKYELLSLLTKLAEDKSSVIVKDLARKLVDKWSH